MKLNLKQRIKSVRFWLAALLISSLVFGILFRIFDTQWLYIATLAPWGLLIPFTLVGMVFAWIINPIRALIKRRKAKKLEDKE